MNAGLLYFSWMALSVATPEPTSGVDWSAKGAFVALSVEDPDGMARWYADNLGFALVRAGDVPDRRIKFSLLRRKDHVLELLKLPDSGPAPADKDGKREAWRTKGYFKFGFYVEDIEGLSASLKAKGVTFSHDIVRPTGENWRTFAVFDPEGNIVQFFGDLERS